MKPCMEEPSKNSIMNACALPTQPASASASLSIGWAGWGASFCFSCSVSPVDIVLLSGRCCQSGGRRKLRTLFGLRWLITTCSSLAFAFAVVAFIRWLCDIRFAWCLWAVPGKSNSPGPAWTRLRARARTRAIVAFVDSLGVVGVRCCNEAVDAVSDSVLPPQLVIVVGVTLAACSLWSMLADVTGKS